MNLKSKALIILYFILSFNLTVIHSYVIQTVADKLNNPWSIVLMPNSDILITEKPGHIKVIKNGKQLRNQVKGVPNVAFDGQGGLMDMVLHPNFHDNHWVYISFSEFQDGHYSFTVLRYRLKKYMLREKKLIFTTKEPIDRPFHYGGRLLFLPDNTLLITTGDGYIYLDKAQDLDSYFGKILRVNDDGSVPSDNPYNQNEEVLPEIWSYGHRNPQGLAYDTKYKLLYSNEHGPKGGDELNLIEPKKNYGWPEITYGIDYDGSIITPHTKKEGMEQPIFYWVPSIALSSMVYYNGTRFPHWTNSLFITGLMSRDVRRLKLERKKIIEHDRLFPEIGKRLRDIKMAPDGSLLILTDGYNAKLLRVTTLPKE